MSALIPFAILIGLAAQIPKPVWIGIGVVAGLAALGWLISKYREQASITPPSARKTSSFTTVEVDQPSVTFSMKSSASSGFQRVQLGTQSPQTFTIPMPAEQHSKTRWLGASESVVVAGLTLPGGLLYYTPNGQKTGDGNPSLIDASFRVASSPADISIRQMDYWPSYRIITPEARRAYLQWQAGGRCDPRADIGYVFLFFYGLERRALLDAPSDVDARQDLPAIEEEVRRLLAIYGENNSFRGYATRFLDHLKVSEIAPESYRRPPQADTTNPYELPLPIRIALGQMAADKFPLNGSWALAWALNDPNIGRRTPVSRCADKFALLFEQEYSRRHPSGIVLPNNKTRLKASYRPASSWLTVPPAKIGDLPDVSATSGTRNKLQTLVDQCTTVLEPYSRYLGRNPANVESLDALLQLPISLWPKEAQSELESIKNSVALGVLCMSFGELSGRLKSAGALSRDKVIALARALESLNIGFEPDVLSGARVPKAEDTVALFAILPADGSLRTDSAYHAAVVTLDLASAVAAADGDTSLDELRLLSAHIDSWTHLAASHRKRLQAHLTLQLRQPPTLASLKKKLDPLGLDAKRKIASFLAHLAQADGQVSPAEVKLLERVYKSLSLDPQAVYSDLHSAAAAPVATPHADTEPSLTTSIKEAAPSGFSLDMSKVAQLQRETAEVSALLAGVFTDDAPDAPAALQHQDSKVLPSEAAQPEPSHSVTVHSLDIDHSAFLRLLVSRKEWSRAELEDAASDLDLMLDGALEQINDMAFDRFDMPFCEGDDPIEINPEILDELGL